MKRIVSLSPLRSFGQPTPTPIGYCIGRMASYPPWVQVWASIRPWTQSGSSGWSCSNPCCYQWF